MVRRRIAMVCHALFMSFHAALRICRLAIPAAISARASSSAEELAIFVGSSQIRLTT